MSVDAAARAEASPRSPVGDDAGGGLSDPEFHARVRQILNRRPAIGLAVGVIRDGRLASFHGEGLADVTSATSISEETVFRIASITKLFTGIAILQLSEQGLVDLDAPANDYLRAFQLVPTQPSFRPATLRHLLTHTAGIPEVVHFSDLLHPGWGPFLDRPVISSVQTGLPMPSLARYYRAGVPVVVEPGTAFAYTNHGFATLGQIIEDMSGLALADYFREHLLEPLGMTDSDLVRNERLRARLATGYVIGPRGPEPAPDRDWLGAGFGGLYSTTRDMARFTAALLGGGANEHGRILEPATLAAMFEPHYQPDGRIPGLGLAFFRSDVGGHRVVGHDGILPGFNSALLVAPDDDLGMFVLTNGSRGATTWLPVELDGLLRILLGVQDEAPRSDIPHHPETWAELCGRYVLQPRISDLRLRLMLSGGAEVSVRGGRLVVRLLTPLPVPIRGLPLEPDDDHDPDVFRLDLSRFGMGSIRVVFGREGGRVTAAHTDLAGQPWSLVRHRDAKARRRWLSPALGVLAVAAAMVATRGARGRRRATASTASRQPVPDRRATE